LREIKDDGSIVLLKIIEQLKIILRWLLYEGREKLKVCKRHNSWRVWLGAGLVAEW
jgi:hypothetical protein